MIMSHKIRFSIIDFNTGEKNTMVVIDPPEPVTTSDMLDYFIRFCIVAGYQPGSVDDAIIEYASDVSPLPHVSINDN